MCVTKGLGFGIAVRVSLRWLQCCGVGGGYIVFCKAVDGELCDDDLCMWGL